MNSKIYLYHKISPLGLNYLGVTIRNPYKYMGSGKYWTNHIKSHKINISDVKTIILFETYDRDELFEKSIYYSELYNIVDSDDWANLIPETGSSSVIGLKHSEESKLRIRESKLGTKYSIKTKSKMSESHKGKICSDETKNKISDSNKGRNLTKEHKDILSKVKTGKKFTQEHKNNIGNSNRGKSRNKGKTVSEETKLKLRKLKGRNKPGYESIPILQYDLNGNLIREWSDSVELKESGFRYSNISAVCRNIRKTTYGYIWKFK